MSEAFLMAESQQRSLRNGFVSATLIRCASLAVILVVLTATSFAENGPSESRLIPRVVTNSAGSRICAGGPHQLTLRLLRRRAKFTALARPLTTSGTERPRLDGAQILTADIDGDGRTDVVVIETNPRRILLGLMQPGDTLLFSIFPGTESDTNFAGAFLLPRLDEHPPVLVLVPGESDGPYRFRALEARPEYSPNIAPRRTPTTREVRPMNVHGQIFDLVEIDQSPTASARLWSYSTEHNWHSESLLPVPLGTVLGVGWSPASDDEIVLTAQESKDSVTYYGETRWDGMGLGSRSVPVALGTIVIGDFDGDGWTDHLEIADSRSGAGSWLNREFYDTPINLPVPGIAEALAGKSVIGVGDFSGKLIDELLARDGNGLSVVRLEADGPAYADFSVQIDGRDVALEPDGTARVSDIRTPTLARVRAPGRELTFDVNPGSRCARSVGLFVDDLRARTSPIGGTAEAEQQPCIGFVPGYSHALSQWGRTDICPPGYGAVETAKHGTLSCCPLPRGMLESDSDEWLARTACPPDSILTGTKLADASGSESIFSCFDCARKIRCTRINSARYRLAAATFGQLWGSGSKVAQGVRHLTHLELPAGIRIGIGRLGFDWWDTWGCIGSPVGALLVGTPMSECRDTPFARVVPLTPQASDPAPPFPVAGCHEPPDPFEPGADCGASSSD